MMINRNYAYSHSSALKVSSVKPVLQLICHGAIEIANTRKMYCPDFGISYGYRTAEEQFELFKKGRKIINDVWVIHIWSDVVTYCDGYNTISIHQTRLAIDFFALDDQGRVDYSPQSMALVATCFFESASNEQVDIDWGGSFKSISDSGHIEVVT